MPSIPSDLEEIVVKIFIDHLLKEARDFINQKIAELPGILEDKLNDQLKAIKLGDEFLSCIVTEKSPTTVTLLKQFSDTSVPGIPGLKLSLLRVAFTIERFINLVDKSKSIVTFAGSPYFFAIEIALTRDLYFISIGGGEDRRSGVGSEISFDQYRAEFRWKTPQIYFKAFMAKSDKGGFLFNAQAQWPFAIPLGATGLGLKGIGVLYGERFAPKFDEDTNADNAVELLGKATAETYVKWAKKPDLKRWTPVPAALNIYGINTVIVDMGSSGGLLRIEDAGIAYFSFGPTITFGGRFKLFDLFDAGEVQGAIDIRSETLFVRRVDKFELCPHVFELSGVLETSASLKDQNQTWVAIGGYKMDGCRVTILELLKLEGGLRVVPFQGAAARAKAYMVGEIPFIAVRFDFWIEVAARLGWNPVEVGGTLEINGSISVNVIGMTIGLGVNGLLKIQVPQPKLLNLLVQADISLSWILPDVHVRVKIFEYNMPLPAAAAATLNIPLNAELAFMQGPDGTLGKLSASERVVWPDVMFIIPLQRRAGGSALIVNSSGKDGFEEEGGIDVVHQFSQLKIEKIDNAGIGVIVSEVRACWLLSQNGDFNERTSQLAIPCTDPLKWQNSFEYAQPGTAQTVSRMSFQTFGLGPAEVIIGSPAAAAKMKFNNVILKSNKTFWIEPLVWSVDYERAVLAQRLSIEFDAPGGTGRLAVKYCEIRLIVPECAEPGENIIGGTLEGKHLVRELGNGFNEWSLAISRSELQYAADLSIGNGETVIFIVAIGYLADDLAEIQSPPVILLTPGNYQLAVEGTSKASYDGRLAPQTDWIPVVRKFTVVNPPLRPYIRYTTHGDERLFGLQYGGWNPNPKGLGFGHYQQHLGLCRSRVGYLSAIYPQLWVAPAEEAVAVEVKVLPCEEGTLAGSKGSRDWSLIAGISSVKEEEFTYNIPAGKGVKTISIFSVQPGSPGDRRSLVDEWSYRVSEYLNSTGHLSPADPGLTWAYGPFGSRVMDKFQQPVIPAGFDLDVLAPAVLRNGWALPLFIAELPGVESPDAALAFLQCLDWSGVFDSNQFVPGESVLARPQKTAFSLIMDKSVSPVGLIIKTSEPFDWRRLRVSLAKGQPGNFTEVLETDLLPSPDGCSCILIAKADKVRVRLQRGEYIIRCRYFLEAAGLPRLTVADDHLKKEEQFLFSFVQPYGQVW